MRDDVEEAACLLTPLGEAGSGRVRYGAAMHFFNRGKLSPETLEIYRALANYDRDDPVVRLADIGKAGEVEILTTKAKEAERCLGELVAEARRAVLAAPAHGGSGAVADGLASTTGAPFRWQAPRRCAIAAALEQAVDLLPEGALKTAFKAALPHLPWTTYDAYPPERIGARFRNGQAYVSLIGEGGAFQADGVDLGIFVVAPRTLYRDHAHAAPELYLPLTGPHRWRFVPGGAFETKPAGEPVWNPAHKPHAILSGDVPFLALFVWTADVNEPAYVIDAPDWAEIEEKLA
jgi:hypothetical protein